MKSLSFTSVLRGKITLGPQQRAYCAPFETMRNALPNHSGAPRLSRSRSPPAASLRWTASLRDGRSPSPSATVVRRGSRMKSKIKRKIGQRWRESAAGLALLCNDREELPVLQMLLEGSFCHGPMSMKHVKSLRGAIPSALTRLTLTISVHCSGDK